LQNPGLVQCHQSQEETSAWLHAARNSCERRTTFRDMASEEWRAPNDDSSSPLSGSTTSTADSRGHGHALPATGKSHRRARSGSIKSAQRWTQEEHELLLHVVERYGCKQWSTVARHMPGRTGKQCRERWINHRRYAQRASLVRWWRCDNMRNHLCLCYYHCCCCCATTTQP
jgi:Myb-like DNA-binding domain